MQKETWNQIAPGYKKHLVPVFSEWVTEMVNSFQAPESRLALDIACGPGTATRILASRFDSVEAFDFSEEMIKAARAETTDFSNIRFRSENETCLNKYDNNGFDCALSMFGIIFFPNVKASLSLVYEKLKPGGQVLISFWPRMQESSYMKLLLEAMQAANEKFPEPIYDEDGLHNEDYVIQLFQNIGFQNVQARSLIHRYIVEDAKTLWLANEESSVHILNYKASFTPEDWTNFQNTAIRELKKRIKAQKEFELRAFYISAQKP